MIVQFSVRGWNDYLYWQQADNTLLKRINALTQEIQRNPFGGVGKPELLRHAMAGYWSRRINDEHRLVYQIHNEVPTIVAARYHYTD